MRHQHCRAMLQRAAGDVGSAGANPSAANRPFHAGATACLALLLGACGSGSSQSNATAVTGSTGSTGSTGTSGSTGSGAATTGGTDYSVAANWVCRPGADAVCTTGLDGIVENPDGSTATLTFTPAANPAIDCFYIYPTVSQETTEYADLTDSPIIQAETRAQVGRLSSRCRVFAPIYRQRTVNGISNPGGQGSQPDLAMLDVQSAWDYYLANDNQGRGVVLIGHSQGAILLQSLIAGSIDGKTSEALLVSAFLAGDPSLGVPPGGVVGGTFAHVPICTEAAQVGCAYAWGTYLAGDMSGSPEFGGARDDGLASACVNPAAPAGGSAMLKFYHSNPQAPWWTEALGQVSGECQSDGSGANILVVTVEPGPFADADTTLLKSAVFGPGSGTHPEDIALVQGNILDVLDAEITTWQARQ
jgi:hypothetical protein